MTLWLDRHRRKAAFQFLTALLWRLLLQLYALEPVLASEPEGPFSPMSADVETRLRQLEQNQQTLIHENRRLSSQVQSLTFQGRPLQTSFAFAEDSTTPKLESTDTLMGDASVAAATERVSHKTFADPLFDTSEEFPLERRPLNRALATNQSSYWTGYDRGFVIRPSDPDESPFELKINGQSQIRYTGFAREEPEWTDSAGNTTTLTNTSSFQIPRGRLILSGFTFRKELLYNLNIDYNTVSNNQINFRAYWLAWRFHRAMTIYAGQSKVPGGREWLLSFVNTQGADRSMATTFFRPSLSQGIWATGEPADGLFYHVMMSNGFNTLGSTPQQLSSLMAFSGSIWYEPLGDFGVGYSDFEWHAEPVIRFGTSLTYAPELGPQGSYTVPENSSSRLSDGTLITQTDALAPGATVNAFKIGLATFDFSYKHRGGSVSGEFYSQDLFAMRATGPIPKTSIYQYGGFVQGGYFLIPQKLESFARYSQVAGPFGTGAEYAGGFNWFFLPNRQNLRFTLDAGWLDHCPADQNRTNYQAGQTGVLVRSQLQMFF